MRTSRLEAFSDGVLAIIITVMVLDLREPAGSGLLSFVYVGIYWTNRHHMFQLTERVTGGILWANLASGSSPTAASNPASPPPHPQAPSRRTPTARVATGYRPFPNKSGSAG